jgi:carboxyl-terminal processing protease
MPGELTERIKKEYNSLLKKSDNNLKALIIDLRDNSGGFLDSSIGLAGLFVPKNDVIAAIKTKERMKERRNDIKPIIPLSLPVFILVNSQTASGSELFIAALMENRNRNTTVLGERTFGMGTVAGMELGPGSARLKLTTSSLYSPKGNVFQEQGIEPDILISSEKDNSFPKRFREENFINHLPAEPDKKVMSGMPEKYRSQITKTDLKQADLSIETEEKGKILPDYMLIRSLEYTKAILLTEDK